MKTIVFCILSALLLISLLADGATTQVNSSLQAAIDAASPGDTLQVAAGIYGKIVIDKSLTLVGDGATILAGNRDACVSFMDQFLNSG